MHDISVAEAVVDSIYSRLEGEDFDSLEIDLSLGHLRFHDTDKVEFWIDNLLGKKLQEDFEVSLSVDILEPKIDCSCGYSGEVDKENVEEKDAHHGVYDIECPECGSDDPSLVSGEECKIERVKVE